jgi:hypothetical protein
MPSVNSVALDPLQVETLLSPERWFQRKIRQLHMHDPIHSAALLHNASNLFRSCGRFRVATACSGSENPIVWLAAFARVVRSINLKVPLAHVRACPWDILHHVFACEVNVQKARQWILLNFNPGFLFADITTLTHSKSWCFKHNSLQLVPACDGLIAGTSCKDFSAAKAIGKDNVLSDLNAS